MKYCSSCMNNMEEQDEVCRVCGKEVDEKVPTHHLLPGTMLNKKFVVGRALGEGGFGITYIGRDVQLDMIVAIKEYYPNGYVNRNNTISLSISNSLSHDRKEFFDTGRERFLQEARILAKFSGSRGVVDVRDFFEENNTAYIVMEYLKGKTLKEYLKENGTLTPEQTICLLMPVMEALNEVHAQGLIHRDISPDNIMLVNNEVKLLDFGAARNSSIIANKSLSVMLKPGYAPEEQYRSKGIQGPWTDIYALCATMYKCITGITPDDSTQRVFGDELKAPSVLGINIEPVVEQALLRGLKVSQKERYQSIEELINGLRGVEKIDDEDSRTVSGAQIVYEDKATEYRRQDRDNVDSIIENKDVTVTKSESIRIEESISLAEDKANAKVVKKDSQSKKRRNKNLGLVLMAAVLVIVSIIGISTIFGALNSITIGGEKFSKKDTRIVLNNKEITADDMKAILSMGKLEYLKFSNCAIASDAMELLGNISSPLTELIIIDCTGIEDYSGISDLKYLKNLTISASDLTDKKIKDIQFDNKEFLIEVNLSRNKDLSDISLLSSVKNLNSLIVDDTSVRDFSVLHKCEILQALSANNCGIADISTLSNKGITELYLNDNQVEDISRVRDFEFLQKFEISNNKVTDISALKDKEYLMQLCLDGNLIVDISSLATTPNVSWLQLSDNQIVTLSHLSAMKELVYLYVNRNQLSNLDGLENAIKLEVLQATENQIENINGVVNCTILKEFNVNQNNISDISLLGKSSETLEKVYFNENNVVDISALANTSNLKYLSFDYNKVTTLDALVNSISLLALSAEYNEIVSMDGLRNSTKLKQIYLSHNKIENMSPIANLDPQASGEWTTIDTAVVDLSNNNISELSFALEQDYTYFAVYNNPIKSFDKIKEIQVRGKYFLFSYVEDMELTGFGDAFHYYNIIDCPNDKRVGVEDAIVELDWTIGQDVIFGTAEEADKQIRDTKKMVLTGSTTQEQTEE